MDAVHCLDYVSIDLLENKNQHRRLIVEPPGGADVLDAIDHRGDSIEPDRRAVAGADDHRFVFIGLAHLVIDADDIGTVRRVYAALGARRVSGIQGGPYVLKTESHRGERSGVGLHAHRRLLGAVDRDLPDAFQLRELLRQDCLRRLVDLARRQCRRRQRQDQDRRR